MQTSAYLHLVTLCLAGIFAGCGDTSDSAREAGLDPRTEQLRELLNDASARGASGILRITYVGDELFESGFGSATCEGAEPVTSAHVFMIGSITKEFTRVLGYVLEEKGYFSLNDSVAELLPDFQGPIGAVTLQQLMNHTGGLPDLIDNDGQPVSYTIDYDYEPVTRDELIERATLAELIAAPGENEEYSNLGYQLLAAIYESVSGESYPDLLRRHVYEPAGMTGTDFWFDDNIERQFADGCTADDTRWGNPIDDGMWGASGPSWNLIGAGGLLSTAESLGRFFEGIGSGTYFENPAQLEKYKSDRMVVSDRRQQRVMGPAGSNGIFNAVAYWMDEDQFNVILMTNRAAHPAEGELFRDILRLYPPDSFPMRTETAR